VSLGSVAVAVAVLVWWRRGRFGGAPEVFACFQPPETWQGLRPFATYKGFGGAHEAGGVTLLRGRARCN